MKTSEEKRLVSRRRFLSLAGGALGGAAAGYAAYHIIGRPLEGILKVEEETRRDFKVISKFDSGDNSYLERVLGDTSEGRMGTVYANNLRDKEGLYQGAWDYIEALQRQSLKDPTQKTKPAEELKDAKKKLLDITKKGIGRILGRKKMVEEAEAQAESQYTPNYNDLTRLRMTAMERVSLLEDEMRELGYKIIANRHNTQQKDNEGVKALGELIGEHDKHIDLLREFRTLTPRQILEGESNQSYKTAIEKAHNYGIKPYVVRGMLPAYAGKAVGGLAGALGLWVGSKVAGGIGTAIGGVYETTKVAGKGAVGTVKLANKGAKGIFKMFRKKQGEVRKADDVFNERNELEGDRKE